MASTLGETFTSPKLPTTTSIDSLEFVLLIYSSLSSDYTNVPTAMSSSNPDPSIYFYSDGAMEKGPVNFKELQELAASGTIGPKTRVWCPLHDDWTTAEEIEGPETPQTPQASSSQAQPLAPKIRISRTSKPPSQPAQMPSYEALLFRFPGEPDRVLRTFSGLMMKIYPRPNLGATGPSGWFALEWEAKDEPGKHFFSLRGSQLALPVEVEPATRVTTYHQFDPGTASAISELVRQRARTNYFGEYLRTFALVGAPCLAILALAGFFAFGYFTTGIVTAVLLIILGIVSMVVRSKLRRGSQEAVLPNLQWIAGSPFQPAGISEWAPQQPVSNHPGKPTIHCSRDAAPNAPTISIAKIPMHLRSAVEVSPEEYRKGKVQKIWIWTLTFLAMPAAIAILVFFSPDSQSSRRQRNHLFGILALPVVVHFLALRLLPLGKRMGSAQMRAFPHLRAFLAGRRVVE